MEKRQIAPPPKQDKDDIDLDDDYDEVHDTVLSSKF